MSLEDVFWEGVPDDEAESGELPVMITVRQECILLYLRVMGRQFESRGKSMQISPFDWSAYSSVRQVLAGRKSFLLGAI